MQIRRVAKGRVYQEIAQQIIDAIQKGELAVGDRLPPERELAEKFGISRPVIREALCALEMAGVIETKHGQGSFIKGVPQEPSSLMLQVGGCASPWEFLEARMIVEGAVAMRAAEVCGEESLALLEDVLQRMERSVEADDGTFPQIDFEFHVALARTTGNAVLSDLVAELCEIVRDKLFREMSAKIVRAKGGPQKFLSEHRRIYEAIKSKVPLDAYRAMRSHIESVIKDMFEET